ncbi:cob(I)yrinic acid a c-diamide adenosyltransferase [bacterium 1XD42-8]|jgi:cob(I)alamin adenosyltransferase|nr:cob(I)yrinic acid a,c-diamide adenosyltransferase [Lachnospiraceae bacterium]RKJ32318.1 cob(I)yrinic acid a c-diamide adenosyltransferase [bacterium 1XD42-8]
MSQGKIQIFCGHGKGKTTAALGQAVRGANAGKSIMIIQFLKGKMPESIEFLKRMEPEIQVFCFEKLAEPFEKLTKEQKEEEIQNIKNGLNFAKKVLSTGGCDLLILDEALGLLDKEIVSVEELRTVVLAKSEDMELILTGIELKEELLSFADEVYQITRIKP